jgi:hypothetical protein
MVPTPEKKKKKKKKRKKRGKKKKKNVEDENMEIWKQCTIGGTKSTGLVKGH